MLLREYDFRSTLHEGGPGFFSDLFVESDLKRRKGPATKEVTQRS